MDKNIFEQLLNDFKAGKISVRHAVENAAVIIQSNYKMFSNYHADDSDFKSNVITSFLLRGHSVFEKYNKKYGSFFNYLYSFVNGLVLTEKKALANRLLSDKVNVLNSIEGFYDMEEKRNFTLVLEDSMNIPYAYKPITKDQLERTLKDFMQKRINSRLPKSIIILALKASYDITSEEIDLICNEYNINKDDFFNIVQKLKNNLIEKREKRCQLEYVRNNAYYNHLKYDDKISRAAEKPESLKNKNKAKFEKNTKRWKKMNNRLLRGEYHLSPTNESIAKELGISERMVNYYISEFREAIDEIKNKIEND